MRQNSNMKQNSKLRQNSNMRQNYSFRDRNYIIIKKEILNFDVEYSQLYIKILLSIIIINFLRFG